jgi:hypothetical protein
MIHLKIRFLKNTLVILFGLITSIGFSQIQSDAIFQSNIRTIRFHTYGNQLSLPIYNLNSGSRMLLAFDDMDGDVKSYYYTYQLCDYDWQPVDISPMDYINGFTQIRIADYQYSSIAYTKYTHYQVTLPDPSSLPSRSGNYIVKVFLDGDTSKLAFTRRLLVVNPMTKVSAQVLVPSSPEYSQTHQRIRVTVNTRALNAFSAGQQVKVLVLQNYRWDNAQGNVPPTFIRGNILEYNSEDAFLFPGGKEWRWIDLQSLRLQNDRADSVHTVKNIADVYMRTDVDRATQKYVYYHDLNGLYQIQTFESIDPNTQGDYANVHFKFAPPDRTPYPDKDVYLFGQLTDYQLNDATKLKFNANKGMYEGKAFLKQGYYSYGYMFINKKDPTQTSQPDGNHFETENVYTILVYYKSFNDQSDELIGIANIDSRTDQPGVSF